MRYAVIIIAVLLLGSGPGGAADNPGGAAGQVAAGERTTHGDQELGRRMLSYGFSATEIDQVNRLLMRISREGLPDEPVAGKIHEGMAKGYARERILAAAEKVASRYGWAYGQAAQIEPENPGSLGNSIAEASAAGLRQEDCERILQALRKSMQSVSADEGRRLAHETILTAREMARRQAPSATVAEALTEVLSRSGGGVEMADYRQQFIHRSRYPGGAEAAGQPASGGDKTGAGEGKAGTTSAAGRHGNSSGGSGSGGDGQQGGGSGSPGSGGQGGGKGG